MESLNRLAYSTAKTVDGMTGSDRNVLVKQVGSRVVNLAATEIIVALGVLLHALAAAGKLAPAVLNYVGLTANKLTFASIGNNCTAIRKSIGHGLTNPFQAAAKQGAALRQTGRVIHDIPVMICDIPVMLARATNSVTGFVANHKKLVLGGLGGAAVLGGAAYYFGSASAKLSEEPGNEQPVEENINNEQQVEKNINNEQQVEKNINNEKSSDLGSSRAFDTSDIKL